MRPWLLVGVAALLAGGCHPAGAPASRPAPWRSGDFEPVKLRVMQALDEDAADLTGAALAMEKELAAYVERALAADEAGELTSEPEREGAGLALIYGAMYVLHDVHLVERGKIDGARLYAARRYDAAGGSLADPAALRAEGTARCHRVGEILVRAQRLRPKDGRIASWIAAASAHEHGHAGVIEDADEGRLLAAVEVDPLFSLFTALILMRTEPTDSPRGRALFARTQAFLDAKMCKDVVPGTKQARYCENTPLAPWNEEAATVILSDEYARRGEDALRRGDVASAMPAVATAKSLLGVLEDDAHRGVLSRWRQRSLVETRTKRLEALAPGQPLPDASFWRSDAFEGMYACATCHTK